MHPLRRGKLRQEIFYRHVELFVTSEIIKPICRKPLLNAIIKHNLGTSIYI
jgi:hypothetical protein